MLTIAFHQVKSTNVKYTQVKNKIIEYPYPNAAIEVFGFCSTILPIKPNKKTVQKNQFQL
jgi:hypothetical protein